MLARTHIGSTRRAPPRSLARHTERGSSLTEFAIVAPLFIAIIYGSLYLADLGVFRLKAQEVARYGAWAFTERPLSNYGDEQFRHNQSYVAARDQIIDEVNEVYADLDGAHDNLLPGRWAKTMSAILTPPVAASDFKDREVQVIPEWANAPFAESLSTLWWILQLLQVGSDVNDLIIGPVRRMGLNEKGQVTVEASVTLMPPIRPQDARQAIEMARVGRERGADLSRWNPVLTKIRDKGGRDIQTTLIADSWKVHQGWSTYPGGTFGNGLEDTHYANIVKSVSKKGITALPLGGLIQAALSLGGFRENLPDWVNGLVSLAIGVPPDLANRHLFSRPYSKSRSTRPDVTNDRDLATGQVSIFEDTDGEAQEDSEDYGPSVHKLESGPLYVDPARPEESPYNEALKKRGPNFMGCDQAEKRGCWDTR